MTRVRRDRGRDGDGGDRWACVDGIDRARLGWETDESDRFARARDVGIERERKTTTCPRENNRR